METTTLTIPEAGEFTAAQIIKTDSAGRIRVTRERREELLDLFEQSAMSGAEFARFYGIKYQTFANWRQKRSKERRSGSGGSSDPLASLVEVELPATTDLSGATHETLVVRLPGGASCEVTSPAQMQLACALIQQLSN